MLNVSIIGQVLRVVRDVRVDGVCVGVRIVESIVESVGMSLAHAAAMMAAKRVEGRLTASHPHAETTTMLVQRG